VAGDSAGGNLTLMVVAWAQDEGLRASVEFRLNFFHFGGNEYIFALNLKIG